MKSQDEISSVSKEIEYLAKMHILYGLDHTPCFDAQKSRIMSMVDNYKINIRADLDPISYNLFRRYFC